MANLKVCADLAQLGRDNLLKQAHLPDVVSANLDKFQQYMDSAHFILLQLLQCLSTAAGVPPEDRYERYHPPELASKTAMLFLHYPATDTSENGNDGGHNSHTDAGVLTLLFVDSPGLQVLSPKTNEWESVSTKPGHAIVNVGDTLRFVSNKRFRSILHRVVLPHDRVASRYATAYFLRAGDQVVFQGLNGERFTAQEWFDKKYDSFEKTLKEQESNPVATGGMAHDLGVRLV
jgi:isopenicillin N synthase-like dioxygenase